MGKKLGTSKVLFKEVLWQKAPLVLNSDLDGYFFIRSNYAVIAP